MKNAGIVINPQIGIVKLCKAAKNSVATVIPVTALNFSRRISSMIAMITSDSASGDTNKSITTRSHNGRVTICRALTVAADVDRTDHNPIALARSPPKS